VRRFAFTALGLSLALATTGCPESTSPPDTDAATDSSTEDVACMPVPDSPCPDGWFFYSDRACSWSPSGPSDCYEAGDRQCHQECETDADCDPCRPHCRTLGLFRNGDSNCNGLVRVCSTTEWDDC
jgi:hypothetical protein